MQDFFFKSYISILWIFVAFAGNCQIPSPNYYAINSLSSGEYLGWSGSGLEVGATADQFLFIPVSSQGNIVKISTEGMGNIGQVFLAANTADESVSLVPYSDSTYLDSNLLWEISAAPVFNNGSNKNMSYSLKSLTSNSDTAFYLDNNDGDLTLLTAFPEYVNQPIPGPGFQNNPGAFWTCWIPGKALYEDTSGLTFQVPAPLFEQSETGLFDLSFDYYPIQELMTYKGSTYQYIITGDSSKIRIYKKPLSEGNNPHHYSITSGDGEKFSGWIIHSGQLFVVVGNELKKYYLNGITENNPSFQNSTSITDSSTHFSAPICDQYGHVFVLDEMGYIRAFDNSLNHKLAISQSTISAHAPLDLYIDISTTNPTLAFFDSNQILDKFEYNFSSTNFTPIGTSGYEFNLKHKAALNYGNQLAVVPSAQSLWTPVNFNHRYGRSFVSTCSQRDTNFYLITYFDTVLHLAMAHFLMNSDSTGAISSLKGSNLALCDKGGNAISTMGNPLLIFNESNNSCEVFVLGYPKGASPKLYTYSLTLPTDSAHRLIYEHHWLKTTVKPDLMSGRLMMNQTAKMDFLRGGIQNLISTNKQLIEDFKYEKTHPYGPQLKRLLRRQKQLDTQTAQFRVLLNDYFSKIAPFPTATYFPIEYFEVFKTMQEAGVSGF
jgi:hypothetical protein